MKAAVKDVMTTHVVAVRQDATYKIMVASLRGRHISALPVLDDQDKVIGVVSEADLLAKEALEVGPHGYTGGILPHEQLAKATGVTAADLMTRPAITIAAATGHTLPNRPAQQTIESTITAMDTAIGKSMTRTTRPTARILSPPGIDMTR